GDLPLCGRGRRGHGRGEPERVHAQYRRDHERERQRARAHAAPGTRALDVDRLERRGRALRLDPRRGPRTAGRGADPGLIRDAAPSAVDRPGARAAGRGRGCRSDTTTRELTYFGNRKGET